MVNLYAMLVVLGSCRGFTNSHAKQLLNCKAHCVSVTAADAAMQPLKLHAAINFCWSASSGAAKPKSVGFAGERWRK